MENHQEAPLNRDIEKKFTDGALHLALCFLTGNEV
jgi:hypothetical protein